MTTNTPAVDALLTADDIAALERAAELLVDLLEEAARAEEKFGRQYDVPDGTGGEAARLSADDAREDCQDAFAAGLGTWWHILLEEVYEALAEDDPAALRRELLQVAAVAIRWVDAIDNREQVTS
jgi:hypothetical protein